MGSPEVSDSPASKEISNVLTTTEDVNIIPSTEDATNASTEIVHNSSKEDDTIHLTLIRLFNI